MIRASLSVSVGSVTEVEVERDDALSRLGLGACDEVSVIELKEMR
jgi:hypothetical protein